MLEIRGLEKSYYIKNQEIRALDGVSVCFGEVGLTIVLGRSGCGKSTLLSVLGGINNADGGELYFDGRNVKSFSGGDFDALRNSYIGFVFQEINLLPSLTVGENLRIAADLQNRSISGADVSDALEAVGLRGYGKRRVNELSGGQKQRVSIARAIVKDTRIILADEPTGNLDSKTGDEIFTLLKEISKERLVIVVSHDRASAFKFADRILEMSDGRITSDLTRAKGAERFCDKEGLTVRFPERGLTFDEIAEFKGFLGALSKEEIDDASFVLQDKPSGFAVTPQARPPCERQYKARMPKIPFRFSLKMAWSNVRTSKAGLIFTTLMLVVAIGLFGLAQVIYAYDVNSASLLTFRKNGVAVVSAKQGVYDELIGTVRTEDTYVFSDGFEREYASLFGKEPNRVYELSLTFSLNEHRNSPFKPDCRKLLVINNQADLTRLGYKGIKYGNYLNDPDTRNDGGFLEVLVPDVMLYMLTYYYPDFARYAYNVENYGIFCEVLADEIAALPSYQRQWVLGDGEDELFGILKNNYHLPLSDYERLTAYFKPYTQRLAEFLVETGIRQNAPQVGASLKYKIVGMVDTGLDYLFEAAKSANGVRNYRSTRTYAEFVNESLYYNVCQLMLADKTKFEDFDEFVQVYAQTASGQYISNGASLADNDWWAFRGYGLTLRDSYYSLRDDYDIWLRSGYAAEERLDKGVSTQLIRNPYGEEGLLDNDVVIPLDDLRALFGEDALERYFTNASAEPDIFIDYSHLDLTGGLVFHERLRVIGAELGDGSRGRHSPQHDYLVSDATLYKLYFGYPHYHSYFLPLPANDADCARLLRLIENYDMFHVSTVSGALYRINILMKTVVKVFEILIVLTASLAVLQIFNFSRRSVKKRTKEIGVMRAMGASAFNVAQIFLLEVLFIIALSTVLSIAFVSVSAELVNTVIIKNSTLITSVTDLSNIVLFGLSPSAIAFTLLFCLALAVISIVLPMLSISRMKPFEAMRDLSNE